MRYMITFALAQLRCEKAAVAENLAAIARIYRQADQQGASIVACPEMSLTGYIDPTRQPQAVLRLDSPEVTALVALTATGRATVLTGLVEANLHHKPLVRPNRTSWDSDGKLRWFSARVVRERNESRGLTTVYPRSFAPPSGWSPQNATP
jgi:predicted amidohydrolase